jgi:predicted RNase H-like HicB family nuclease
MTAGSRLVLTCGPQSTRSVTQANTLQFAGNPRVFFVPANVARGSAILNALAMSHTVIMKLVITIVQDEDGTYIAECPAIPGCVSQGKSEQEAEKNIRDAIRECLDVRAELGMPLTVTTREIEVPV